MIIETLKNRRSIRRYADTPVEKEKVEALIQAALLSPSSRGIRPWEFIVVDDGAVLQELAHSKEHGASFISDAPLGIVVIADTTMSDVWIEDTSIASIIIQIAAETLELGSCWVQIRERMHDDRTTADMYIRELLGIPEHYTVESVIGIGYPDEVKPGYTDEDLHYEKVRRNTYDSPFF
jgi:nitroreductase